MSQVLASVEPGMAFDFEGHQYIKSNEIQNGCYVCESLEDPNKPRFLSGSRKVTVL